MRNNPDTLAVIISTYNAPRMLRLALDGYARQTDRRFTIYIADDGSGMETKTVINAFGQKASIPVQHIWHEDAGFRKARVHNMTIMQVREPYVLLTDGDCIPPPGMIAAHRACAEKGMFISGSRILLSKDLTETLQKEGSLDTDINIWRGLIWRLRGHINRIFPLLPPVRVSRPHQRLSGIRGCHLACWRDDILKINGFDESFEGWGREDSDLAVRLMHAGIQRRDLRGLPVLHLWHAGEDRRRLKKNDALLQNCLATHRVRARNGIEEMKIQ